MTPRLGFTSVGFCLFLAIGCSKSQPESPTLPEINIAVYAAGKNGPISGPLYHWKEKWETENGARLNLIEIPYGQLYERIMADVRSGQGEFDGVVTPAFFYGDMIQHGYLRPIDEFRKNPKAPAWQEESVVPAIARLLKWNGVWYGCPNDADAHILYYRKDVLNDPKHKKAFQEKKGRPLREPPRTWEEVAEIAEFFAGKDWNGDGKTNEASISLHLKPGGQGYWHFWALSGPYVVNPGPSVTRHHNVYAFDPETLDPIIDSKGHVKALDMLRRLVKTGDRSMTSWGLEEAWSQFLGGESLFCFTWGDLGRQAQDPSRSKVKGKLGCCALPGTLEVWSRKDDRWKTLRQPNFVSNTCGASWHGVVCAKSKHPELAYSVFALQANRLVNMFNVTQGWSGIDLGRTYQFLKPHGDATPADYAQDGFDLADVQEFTNAYYENYYNTQTMQEYLRIPGASRFYTALDEELSLAMSDPNLSSEKTLQQVAAKWRQLSKDLDRELGEGKLKELYQQSIGYKPEAK